MDATSNGAAAAESSTEIIKENSSTPMKAENEPIVNVETPSQEDSKSPVTATESGALPVSKTPVSEPTAPKCEGEIQTQASSNGTPNNLESAPEKTNQDELSVPPTEIASETPAADLAAKETSAVVDVPAQSKEEPEAPQESPATAIEVSNDTETALEGTKARQTRAKAAQPADTAPNPTEVKDENATAKEATGESENPDNLGPYVGQFVEQTKVLLSGHVCPLQGQVVAHQEASGRLPPRWTVQWETTDPVVVQDDWMEEDLNPETPYPVGDIKGAFGQIEERYQQHLQLELESNNLVSTLLLYAAMEEALQINLQNQQESSQEASSSSRGKGKRDPHPPLYYSSNPSSYLKAPTATDTTSSATANKVQMTPASLAQRVRAGSQWAWKYLQSQHPSAPLPVIPSAALSNQRRSLRQPKPPPPPPPMANPTPVQPGGRVAMWWLEQLENLATGKTPLTIKNEDEEEEESTTEEKEEDNDEPMEDIPEGTTDKIADNATINEDGSKKEVKENIPEEASGLVDAMEEDDDDDESEKRNDDDDDYGSRDADLELEEDEDLEDVERERKGNLSPVPDVEEEEKEDQESEEETEEDIEQAIIYENPYFQPSFPALLEYMANPKAFTGENVQTALCEAIMKVKFNKRSAMNGLATDDLSTVDQVVLDQEAPDYPPGKVVLKSMAEDTTFTELQKMDAHVFSRCKFTLDVIGDEESSMQMQRKEELILQEIQFKEQKAWDKWRHKGIHEGYTTWPSWHGAIAKWVNENCTTLEPAATETVDPSSDAAAVEPNKDDEALAKSLEESESGTGRRRTARRSAATASEGVFYGNQSQLTQKQLMDALIRLVKNNKFQTLIGLQSLVGDDSTDPIRRSRLSLGRLVWKRNQLSRKSMDSQLSDAKLFSELGKEPILTIQPPSIEGGEESAESKPPEMSIEEMDLVQYIQGLHSTELQLRRFVTKHLAEIPVSIIATAADERMGSTEAMDAIDFEDPTGIQWHVAGNELIKKLIFRPANSNGNSTDMTPCFWYEIQDFSKSIESEGENEDEPDNKERRMRFRAIPIPTPGEANAQQEQILILTEGQVHAGMKAAEFEKKNRSTIASDGNPFSGASGDKVTLIPVDAEEGNGPTGEIHGKIVGYDNVIPEDDAQAEYQILVLPESGESREAFWASIDVRADTASYMCQPVGESTTWYSIEQFDYHQDSEAYRQCEAVLHYLRRQSKAGPFTEPVDPVALNIPTYPQIVKEPMDISTVAEKLENGQYSSILPGQTIGNSPTAKMLNGPFRKDVELIFNNAMLFNPPDDWIYQAAAQLKKNALKKISDLSQSADKKANGGGRSRQKRSVYVDEDSDVDMYEYQSDNDEEFDGGGTKGRKRKRSARGGAQKDECAARAIENPIRLQNTLRDAGNLRGPFANLPINLSSPSFTLPPAWSCRLATAMVKTEVVEEATTSKNKRTQEMAELLAMQKLVEETESAGLRRSSRAHQGPAAGGNGLSKTRKGAKGVEYFLKEEMDESRIKVLPTSRSEVETQAEKLHEEHYSRLYQAHAKGVVTSGDFGAYSNGSFPPFLGRVVPISSWDEVSWEIRASFVVPALRWVLRGLIQSGHLTAVDPMVTDVSSGVILTNDIYYWDASLQPFEVLDSRELQRKKRANKENSEESEDDVEMSEYEKARAERVVRNAERLKALGLA